MEISEDFLKLMNSIQAHTELDHSSVFDGNEFYPNMCHVCRCFGGNVNLKRCGACGMISYCSKEHQLQDWTNHKEICKALCQIRKEWEADNLYESFQAANAANAMERMLSSRLKDDVGTWLSECLTNMSYRTSIVYLDCLMKKTAEILKRPLKFYENQMIKMPRVCAVCFECNHKLLSNCAQCPQISFCQEHKNDSSHENDCFKFLSTVYSPREICVKIPPSIQDLIGEMKLPLQTEVAKLPTSLTKFFERYFSQLSFHTFPLEKKVAFNTYFSEKFSAPLTILFAMEKLGLNLNSMKIHVVGANHTEQIFLDWEIMLHYLPQLKKLKLVLIGLELLPGYTKMQKECKLCKKDKKQLIFETNLMEYQKYCRGLNYEKPDMIVCFNAGLYAYPTWEKAIDVCAKGECPLLVTDYHQKEGFYDKRIIDSKFPSANCVFSDLNPFTSLNFGRSNVILGISASNQFITLYKNLGTAKASK